MSSDAISNSYMCTGRMRKILIQVEDHAEELFRCGSKIGRYILFPAYRIDSKNTINSARGMFPKIGDRMDLTLEAIRRHYVGEKSPLTDVLDRYLDFFELFVDFEGVVDFWLLNDLVEDHYRVQFFIPFDNIRRNAAPIDMHEYIQLKSATVRFLNARTEGIAVQ